MGCQSSKQSENTKIGKSKLPKLDKNGKISELPNVTSQPVTEKVCSEQKSKEAVMEKVTFSTEEVNDMVENSIPELPAQRSTNLKVKTIASRSIEPNEEANSNGNEAKEIKIYTCRSERSADKDNEHKHLEQKLSKKHLRNNKQLHIRTKTKRSRADPEDDTLYEIPLKMPELDLVPSRSEDSVA